MRRLARCAATCAVPLLLLAACGGDDDDDDAAEDPVAAAQAAVDDARAELEEAEAALDDAHTTFCDDSRDYIDAVDRYGSAFSDAAVTVGDVTTAGADLEEPEEAAQSSAEAVVEARDRVAAAEQSLADAEAALAEAETGTSGPPAETPTTTTLVPPATVDRVQEAQEDLATAFEGVTPATPVREATEQVNAAAFALQVASLRLFADAGCLDDEQAAQAVQAVVDYTTALQTSLVTAGYLDGEVDGIYGPETVAAVEALQSDSGLPVTGLVDRATAAALDAAVEAAGGDAANLAIAHTAALQALLAAAGYWTGPIDGQWTDALTAALQSFQTDLGVPATGEVDAATLAAAREKLAELTTPVETTTTAEDATATTDAAAPETEPEPETESEPQETTGTSTG
jgi:peptidoglycan hydrolase-like protein with peptidoglycan-binding domain